MIETPWGLVQIPMAILPYFYCPKCDRDLNVGECSHSRQDFTPPVWIREYALWCKGKFEVSGELLNKFLWLKANANIPITNSGFETGNYTGWTTSVGGSGALTVVSSQAREGTYSSESSGLNDTVDYTFIQQDFGVGYSTFFVRWYIRATSWTLGDPNSSLTRLLMLRPTGSATDIERLEYAFIASSTRRLRFQVKSTATYEVDLSANTWICLEVKILIHTTAGELRLWVDGTERITVTSINTGSTNVGRFLLGYTVQVNNFTYTGYLDSVVADDASYIGPIAAGWTHKILGIANANISKINGVAKASIAKVNGV